MKIQTNESKLKFIELLSSSYKENILLDVNNEILNRLINRLKDNKTTVLPYVIKNKIYWLILNRDKIKLIKHKKEITDIIVDDYGEINNFNLQKFDKNKEIGQKGAELFPEGYAFFTSPNKNSLTNKVLRSINMWMELDDKRPEIKKEYSRSNVYTLRSHFHQAIALKNWGKAESYYKELKEKRFVADYNIYFLKIKLLSSQDKWREIWKDDIYSQLTRFKPLPKKVRQSLLTAFYNVEIKPLEEKDADLDEILIKFKNYSGKLGSIINYRTGLSGEVIYRLFTYKYYFDNDLNKLKEIKNISENKNTIKLVEKLSGRISSPKKRETLNDNMKIFNKAQELIEKEKYDDAIIYALDMESSVHKTKILMSTGIMTEDKEIIELAKEEYLNLDEEKQKKLLSKPYTKSNVKIILGYNLLEGSSEEVEPFIDNWLDWFKAVDNNNSNELLTDSLESILTKDDYDNWDFEQIENLEYIILDLISKENLDGRKKSILNRGISDFVAYLLKDPKYPNDYADDLYLNILWALNKYCNKNKNNTRMLYKITEGILALNLGKRDDTWDFISDWFDMQPILTLQENLLDTLELFHDYGYDNISLSNLWITWIGSLINSFSRLKEVELELWYQLGKDIETSTDLLNKLQEIISEKNKNKDINIFNQLDGEVITIYTFREKSANRVKEKIESINSSVNIRICTDSKLTSRAEDYARNSDINIITTDCISHSLTYGISPYLKEDSIVYPRSSGQSAILDSIEEFIKNN